MKGAHIIKTNSCRELQEFVHIHHHLFHASRNRGVIRSRRRVMGVLHQGGTALVIILSLTPYEDENENIFTDHDKDVTCQSVVWMYLPSTDLRP